MTYGGAFMAPPVFYTYCAGLLRVFSTQTGVHFGLIFSRGGWNHSPDNICTFFKIADIIKLQLTEK